MTENQKDILERAVATINGSARGISWVIDCDDTRALIESGELVEVEKGKFGNTIKVRLP